MKKLMLFFALGFLLLAGAYRLVDEVLAVVGDEIITLSDVKAYEKELYKFLSQKYSGKELEQKFVQERRKLLDNMIQRKLLLVKARQEGLSVEEDLKITMKNLAKQYGFSTVQELEQAMKAQGMDVEEWKRTAKENLLQQKLIQKEVEAKLSVTEGEIRDYYEAHREEFGEPARWVLRAIKVEKNEEAEARKKKIDEVLAEKGFDEAVKLSAPPFSSNGGELGELTQDEIRPEFLEAIKKTPAGALTPWLEAEDGWYKFLVEKYIPPKVKSLSQVRREIENKILAKKRQEALRKFIEELKKEIPVRILRRYP